MHDSGAPAGHIAAVRNSNSAIKSGHGGELGRATEQDLLLYMGDLISELEAMAVSASFEGLADLLGYAHRETERHREARQQSALPAKSLPT